MPGRAMPLPLILGLLTLAALARPQDAPTTRPAADPAAVAETLRPLIPRLPKPTSFTLGEVTAERDQLGLAFLGMPPDRRQKLDASVQSVAGFAGTDIDVRGESIDFTVLTFDDPALAAQYPQWKATSFQHLTVFIEATGISLDKTTIDRPTLPGSALTAVRLRATGKIDATGKPYTNTHIRVAQGHHVLEIVLRNLTLPEKDSLALLADAAKRLDRKTATTKPATAPRPGP